MNNFLKYLFCILFLQFEIVLLSNAQIVSLSPYVLSSSGNYSTNTFGSISATVGEIMVTTISSNSVILTQGFQQPFVNSCSFVSVANGDPSTICNGTSSTLSVNTSNTNTPLTYVWSPSLNLSCTSCSTPVASPKNTTTYTVLITDANLCTSIATATIVVNSLSVIATTNTTTVCNGQNVSINASASGGLSPYTFSWSTSGSLNNLTIPNPIATPTVGNNSYVLTVQDKKGCKGTTSVNILDHALPNIVIRASQTTICSGAFTTLTAEGGKNYSWSPSKTINPISVSPTTNTTYSVIASDTNGCSNYATIFISVTPFPEAKITANPSAICLGTSATLTGTGGKTYSWLDLAKTNAIIKVSPKTSTTYTLVASNDNCEDTATFRIQVDSVIVSISGKKNICVGQSTQLKANVVPTNGNTFLWSPNGEKISIITISPTSQTTYSVKVTNTNSGCSDSTNILVTTNLPPIPKLSAPSTLCMARPATLTASGGTTYLWSPGGATTSSITVTPFVPKIHTYSVTISNGICSVDTLIKIDVLALPSIVGTVSPIEICFGESINLKASGGIAYSWINVGAGDSITITPTQSSTYTVVGMGSNGCLNFDTTSVAISTIKVDAGNNITICPGINIILNATINNNNFIFNYKWSPGIYLDDSLIQSPLAKPDSTTNFIVEGSNGKGCYDKDTITVCVKYEASCIIHIYNGITPNGDGKNDTWEIEGIRFFNNNTVTIFNRWGTRVWEGSNYDNKNVVWKGFSYTGETLPSGTYYYVIKIKLENNSTETFSNWIELTR